LIPLCIVVDIWPLLYALTQFYLSQSFPLYFTFLGNFEITPSGYILVKKALDAEVKSVFNLTIEAKDEGQPSRSNTVRMTEILEN